MMCRPILGQSTIYRLILGCIYDLQANWGSLYDLQVYFGFFYDVQVDFGVLIYDLGYKARKVEVFFVTQKSVWKFNFLKGKKPQPTFKAPKVALANTLFFVVRCGISLTSKSTIFHFRMRCFHFQSKTCGCKGFPLGARK